MRKWLILSFLFLFAFINCSAPTKNNEPPYTSGIFLTGTVSNKDGQPLPGAIAKLQRLGLSDTTDANGRYTITGNLPNGMPKIAAGASQDTMLIIRDGQLISLFEVNKWNDTMPSLFVVQRNISGPLQAGNDTIGRIEAVLRGDSINTSRPLVAELWFNKAISEYSGFIYFVYTVERRNYSLYVNVYNLDSLWIGRSDTITFNSLAGDIIIPSFSSENAAWYPSAGRDTAVLVNGTIRLHGKAAPSFGGTITKWEWKIGSSPFVQTSSGDTVATAPTLPTKEFICILRVTDNLGYVKTDSLFVQVVQNGTFINAKVITANETWTKSAGPYFLSGDVQIPNGITLTIEAGTEIYYHDSCKILVKGGAVIANGSAGDSIVLSPFLTSKGDTLIKFEGSNLSISQLSYLILKNADVALRVGDEEHVQAPVKNSGTLSVSHFRTKATSIIANGIGTSAAINLSSAILDSTLVEGMYPWSEPISLTDASLTNCSVISDSYNKGISLNACSAMGSHFYLGCCGANITFTGCTIQNSAIEGGTGVTIQSCSMRDVRIDVPEESLNATNSSFTQNDTADTIVIGYGAFDHCSFNGTDSVVGLVITGSPAGTTGPLVIDSCLFQGFSIAVMFTGSYVSTVSNSNFSLSTVYAIKNLSNGNIGAIGNYWGTSIDSEISAKIYDYYDNIQYGVVSYSPYSGSTIVGAGSQ